MSYIPSALIILRFVLGPLVWLGIRVDLSRLWFVAGFILAFISDYYDGVIARKLGVSTPSLRLADGWVDTWFYGWVVACIWADHSDILKEFSIPILILMFLQISEWIFGFFKFKKLTSYHALSAKFWGITLFGSIMILMLFDYAGLVLWIAIIAGWVSSIENWAMTLLLREWRTDVPSIFHAWRMHQDQINY